MPTSKIEAWWPFPTYSVSWLSKDKHFFVFPISQNRTLNIVAFVSTPEETLGGLRESWTSTGERSQLAKDFEDFEETVRKVISLMDSRPSKWILNDREPLEQWVWARGKVVLMGDAAHAMLPHQGASQPTSSTRRRRNTNDPPQEPAPAKPSKTATSSGALYTTVSARKVAFPHGPLCTKRCGCRGRRKRSARRGRRGMCMRCRRRGCGGRRMRLVCRW